jgi:integrase
MSAQKTDGGSAKARVKNLTKRAIDSLCPETGRYIVWDATLKGFGVRVEPLTATSAQPRKTFIVRYRAGGGRAGTLRQATVGRYGTVTVEQARKTARAMLGAASAGGDPIGEAQGKRRAGVTVAEVCDWYLERAAAGRILGRKGRPLKASTVAMDRSRIDSHVRRLIGRKPVASLTAHGLEEFQADVAALKTIAPTKRGAAVKGRAVTGGPGVASRTLAMLSAIFGHATRSGLIASNPAKGSRKIAVTRRTTRLSLEQIRDLGEVMRASSENPVALAAIRFMLLTGTRRSEALGARREALIGEGGLTLADSKSGPQTRPIGKAALAPFAPLNRGERGWLFPSDRADGPFKNVPKALKRVSAKANLSGISAHILRHSFASIAGELGYSELTIAGLLGHSAGSVTAGYVHLDASLVAAADRVSAVIARALDGEPDAAVVPLRHIGAG